MAVRVLVSSELLLRRLMAPEGTRLVGLGVSDDLTTVEVLVEHPNVDGDLDLTPRFTEETTPGSCVAYRLLTSDWEPLGSTIAVDAH